MIAYYIVAIMASIATVAGVLHQVLKKNIRDSAREVTERTSQVLSDALADVKKDRELNESVQGYNSVLAANRALRQVIDDSSTQLAESAKQLARNSEVLAHVRMDLASCLKDKGVLQERIAALEGRVQLLARDLASFAERRDERGQ